MVRNPCSALIHPGYLYLLVLHALWRMFVAVLLSLFTAGGEQEKNEEYLSMAMNIVAKLRRDDVSKVIEKERVRGGGVHRTQQ